MKQLTRLQSRVQRRVEPDMIQVEENPTIFAYVDVLTSTAMWNSLKSPGEVSRTDSTTDAVNDALLTSWLVG